MRYKKLAVTVGLALAIVAPFGARQTAWALFDNQKGLACQGINTSDNTNCGDNAASDLGKTIRNVLGLLSLIVAIICIFMTLVGIAMIGGAGESTRAEKGRKILFSALLGLGLAVIVQFVLKFVVHKVSVP